MTKQCFIMAATLLLGVQTISNAQEKKEREQLEEVVVTATKFPLKKENTGKVINKITQEQIQQNAGKSVIELLNNVVGIEIRGTNSAPGEPRGVFVRGGRSNQVLVLIDGVPVSDPTGIQQSYDLRLLSLNQIESIEILKGASSSLYGTGAATGVINIILKKASKDKVSATYEVSLGTNSTASDSSSKLNDRNQNITVNGTSGKLSYNTYLAITGIDGISAAKSQTDVPFESDPFNSKSGFINLKYAFNKDFQFETFFNYDEFEYKYDTGAYSDSNINNGDQNQLRFGFKPSYTYDKGQVYLLASINDLDRRLQSFGFGSLSDFNYNGRSLNFDLVNKYEFSDQLQLITGINYQDHNNQTVTSFSTIDRNLANFNTVDPYASLVYITDFGLSVNAGSRLNIHSNYGNHFVYDGNLAYQAIDSDNIGLKLNGSYSSAFIAPSLYQLFSSFGNQDLDPETSTTAEFGFEFSHRDAIKLNAVYFDRTEQDKIIFLNLPAAPWGIYDNALEDIDVSGIETELTVKPTENINVFLNYTYINKDEDTDYIPKNKLFAGVDFNFDEAYVGLVYKNVGERTFFDTFGSFGNAGETVILPSYSLFDINANYTLLNGKVTFFATASNLFNEDYEETLGYNTRGRNYRMGVRLQF